MRWCSNVLSGADGAPARSYPQLGCKRLTTAEILYHMPDHPGVLQSFIWQTDDVAPKFPRLQQFLDHWRREIEASIHSIRVAHADLGHPTEWTAADIHLTIQ